MNKIRVTPEQCSAIGEVIADNFGCHFQTAEYAGGNGWLVISYQHGLYQPIRFAYITPDGRVIHDPPASLGLTSD